MTWHRPHSHLAFARFAANTLCNCVLWMKRKCKNRNKLLHAKANKYWHLSDSINCKSLEPNTIWKLVIFQTAQRMQNQTLINAYSCWKSTVDCVQGINLFSFLSGALFRLRELNSRSNCCRLISKTSKHTSRFCCALCCSMRGDAANRQKKNEYWYTHTAISCGQSSWRIYKTRPWCVLAYYDLLLFVCCWWW